MAAEPFFEQTVLFPKEEHSWYRIPSIVVSKNAVVLAFCDRRIGSVSDYGHETQNVLRRSLDGGETWEPIRAIASEKKADLHGGPAVVDQITGRIFKFYQRIPASVKAAKWDVEHPEEMLKLGCASYVIQSGDDGETWSRPRKVPLSHPAAASRMSVGNGVHGVQLGDGRLLIQGGYYAKPIFDRKKYNRACLIYSDDHGETWKVGGTYEKPGLQREFCMLETTEGAIYINSRTPFDFRAVTWSYDRGATVSNWVLDRTLLSGCHAGMVRYDKNCILFSSPAEPGRKKMTVRVSYDEGKTWAASRLINEGPSGYSDLAVTKEMVILCLYESGKEKYKEYISLSRFNLQWLTSGQDPKAMSPPLEVSNSSNI